MKFVNASERSDFVNAKDDQGNTTMYYATNHDPERITKVLDLSADPFACDPGSGIVILHRLLRHLGQTDRKECVLLKLLQLGCDPARQDKNGQTALHALANNPCSLGFSSLVNILMRFVDESGRNAFVNATDHRGLTAMHYTSYDARKVCTLLELSASPFVRDHPGSLVLSGLLNNLPGLDEYTTIDVILGLLLLGCDPMVQNHSGRTALHLVVRSCTRNTLVSVFMRFVEKSMRTTYINMMDTFGKPAIFYTMNDRSIEIFQELLRHGADPLIGDQSRSFSLHRLLWEIRSSNQTNFLTMITTLLEYGADLYAQKNKKGQTALHILSRNDNNFDFVDGLDTLIGTWYKPKLARQKRHNRVAHLGYESKHAPEVGADGNLAAT